MLADHNCSYSFHSSTTTFLTVKDRMNVAFMLKRQRERRTCEFFVGDLKFFVMNRVQLFASVH